MKLKHHFWSSLAAGGALSLYTGSPLSLAGAMIGGVVIDADHLIDQLWSISRGAPFMVEARDHQPGAGPRAWLAHYLRRRKLTRLPLIFHSYELLSALAIFSLRSGTPFVAGVLAGYFLHLALDLIRHHHEFRSPLFYLLSFRLICGFRRDRLIKPEYL